MDRADDATAIPRKLAIQAAIGCALGLGLGAVLLATDALGVDGLRGDPVVAAIVLLGSVITVAPCVLATAIGLLAFDGTPHRGLRRRQAGPARCPMLRRAGTLRPAR